ncbi:amidohydrolase family protein [Variovorax sp. OAS795]|uniref:amidohydrolase family protein n=1 Tax=Variovorax sp. OAS795 TaxID=3034231 RepID=UPI0033908C07
MLSVTTPSRFDLPPGSTDCHVHVFDPARFHFDSARSYTPPAATAADLIGFQQKMRMHRVVLVQPSCYGSDNAAMLDALAQFTPAQARGIAVLDFERTDATMLHALHARRRARRPAELRDTEAGPPGRRSRATRKGASCDRATGLELAAPLPE